MKYALQFLKALPLMILFIVCAVILAIPILLTAVAVEVSEE